MDVVYVAAAVIVDAEGRILIAKRSADKHQGGLWEFPGGKVEAGEPVKEALSRELHEELGIRVESARRMIRVHHHYPDKSVLLDVWRVDEISGQAHGREGQPIEWVTARDLSHYEFPEANQPIVMAAQLPDCYLVTPAPGGREVFLKQLDEVLDQGIRLIQLRAKGMEEADYKALAIEARQHCHAKGAKLLLNGDPAWVAAVGADGVQLSSGLLRSLDQRPLPRDLLVGASCHNAEELQKAQQLGADFALLSPIKWTKSHPEMEGLGWQTMQALIDEVPMPVYALGGVSKADLVEAHEAGAQGIAAIRSLWPGM